MNKEHQYERSESLTNKASHIHEEIKTHTSAASPLRAKRVTHDRRESLTSAASLKSLYSRVSYTPYAESHTLQIEQYADLNIGYRAV